MILACDRKKTTVYSCRICGSQNIVKSGHNADGNQQFWCKDCGKRGVLEPKNSYSAEQKDQILAAYTNERSSMRGLEKHVPGLSRHIVYHSLGTPLTPAGEHYLNAARGKLTVDRLAHAIEAAVTNTAMRQRAAELGSKIQAEDGIATTVAIIQRIEGIKS